MGLSVFSTMLNVENKSEVDTEKDLCGFILFLQHFSSVALSKTWATVQEKISYVKKKIDCA